MKLIIITALLLLISCDREDIIEDETDYFRKICIDGHVYYTGFETLAIELNDDGIPVKCEVEK